ncbi:MAG TPA: YihY/virulence factor BrkB family protein, partial [Candidatus Stackebrandtia faecavium]|nr:YihY/virulence factor BrkB family protein [Candidatus Stackebrandtia faecavium]
RLSRTTAGIVALVALIITGVNWVQAVRSSIRAVWLLEQQPGNPILRWLVDLAVLIVLGIVLLLTLGLTAIGHIAAEWIETGLPWLNSVISWTGTVFGILLNALLAAALLSGLPRLALPLRRVLPPALYVAIGLELLKTAGTWYISSVADKPAYQAVGSAVGLLLFLFIFNQMLLFASAWTATSVRGRAVDMAERKRIHTDRIHKVVS